jgi:hypothetical protein
MRMLARAGDRRAAVHPRSGDGGRCGCLDCEKGTSKKVQRTRENRTWRREAWEEISRLADADLDRPAELAS